jgi:hypothetical protein
MRYLKAFFTTLRMVSRGEQPRYTTLQSWVDETAKLVDEVIKIADQYGLSKEERKKIVLRLDGRSVNMETILSTVRYHATQEYPHLLLHKSKHILTAIYATNLDDRYRLSSLQNVVELTFVKEAITRLSTHLDAIPPSQTDA